MGPDSGRWSWLTLLVLLPCAGAILGLIISVLSSFVAPKKYESVTMIQIHPLRMVSASGEQHESTMRLYKTDRFLETEIEAMRSREALMRIVERLNLTNRWELDSEMAVLLLEDSVETHWVEGTDLVRIVVRHGHAAAAHAIAKSVVAAYRERRSELERDRAGTLLKFLESEVRLQEDLVEEKRKLLHTIVRAVGVPYLEALSGRGVMGEIELELWRTSVRDGAKLAAEKREKEIEIKSLLRLDSAELLSYLVQSNLAPALIRASQAYDRKKAELEAMKARVEEEDGDLRMLKQDVGALKVMLEKGVFAYQEKMQTDLMIIDGRLEKLSELIQERRFEAVDVALQSQDIVEAKDDYEISKGFLSEMKIEMGKRRIALRMPHNLVTVHEEPSLARSPSSPSPNLSILMGITIGAGVGLLLAFPVAGVMVARS